MAGHFLFIWPHVLQKLQALLLQPDAFSDSPLSSKAVTAVQVIPKSSAKVVIILAFTVRSCYDNAIVVTLIQRQSRFNDKNKQ